MSEAVARHYSPSDGLAEAIAEAFGCSVTGIDLTPSFSAAAAQLSRWTGLDGLTAFRVGDACALPFADGSFDAAMTIHVAMNIPRKDELYGEAHRVLRPGGMFGIYDVLRGDGGEALFPVPSAREPSLSHLATADEMQALLDAAGFAVLDEVDSSEESLEWFRALQAHLAATGPPAVGFGVFLGDDFPRMAANQVANLAEGRIRTVSYIWRA